MGTINYKTSEFITLAYNTNNIDYDDYDYFEYVTQDYFDQIIHRLKHEHFYRFNITVEPGYYEGFSIQIEPVFYMFEDWKEKKEAQKEITCIKKFLLECSNNFELVACCPGWCTGYASREDTVKEIAAAVKAMREAVKATPTASQYLTE